MAPKSWASTPQAAFLSSYLPLYETYQTSVRRYQPFWDKVNAEYLERWPVLPPSISAESLDEVEFKVYSNNLNKLYSRIKEWFRWRCNNRSRNTSNKVTSKEMKDIYSAGTRNAKKYELFVKQNPDIFQPKYEAECTRQGASGRDKLMIWHKVAREVWEEATGEQRVAVEVELVTAQQGDTVVDQPDPCTPSDYQKYWEKLPAILSKMVTLAVRKAGVLAFVTIVGPVPKAGGQILATTLQFGDKEETPLFSSAWADHDHVLVNQLASFASRYEFYLCAQRSLLHAEKSEVVAQDAPDSVKTAGAEAENGESEGLASSSSESVDLPADAIPSTNPDPSAVNLTNDQPQPEVSTESSSSTAQSADLLGPPPNATQALDIISSQAPDATGGTANTNRNSFDLSRYDLTDFSIANDWQEDEDMWADPEILEAISRMNAPNIEDWSPAASSTTMSTVLSQPSPKSVNVHVPDSSTPHNNLLPGSDGSMIAPPALNSISTTASAMLIAPAPNMSAIALPPLCAPVPDMSPPAPLPLPAPSSTAETAFLNSSAPAPPAINMSITALSTLHSTATDVAVATPALPANIHSPIPTHSTVSAKSSLSAFPTFPLQTTNASTPTPGLTPGAVPNSASPAVTSSNIVPTTWSSGGFTSAQFNSVPPPSTTHKGSSRARPHHRQRQAAKENLSPTTPSNAHVSGDNNRPNENVPLVPTLETHAPPKDFSASDLIRSPFHDAGNSIRRSSRAPVPSTRLEKLNEIGTNIALPRPPVDQTADNEEPTWFAPALAHLKRTDLGASWIILLEKWAEHEYSRGWKSGKGLPAKGRPEEWSQWATKARHGVRNYENIPNITDPNDLGIAVVKWVQSFHPSDFSRTGPHGVVSLLTLMAWWGTAALTPSSWNDDSRPQWQALVKELLDQFDHLLSAKSAAKRPREDDILGETHENKR
ncbi:hypothetical protein H1R20_g4856, partial [Candolleomyces eurysporus]